MIPPSLLVLSPKGGLNQSRNMVETVSYMRLAEGSGTTLVDQMRPALGWRCRCSLFRSREAMNGTSFGVEQMGDVVWSSRSLSREDTVSAIQFRGASVQAFPASVPLFRVARRPDQHSGAQNLASDCSIPLTA